MSKSRDIADSAATINYIDDLTSAVQSQIDSKDSFPSQTGNSGKFLTTNGSAASWDAVDVSSEITGTLPVANGGTGAATLTANNVLLGNGTSAPLAVAPSTSGNVLTSNGTTWQSTAPAGGGAWTLLGTYTASNASTIDVTNFSSTYDDYAIVGTLSAASASPRIRIKIGSTYGTASYVSAYYDYNSNSQNSAADGIDMGSDIGDASSGTIKMSFITYVNNANESTFHGLYGQTNNARAYNMRGLSYSGYYYGATGALTGLQYYPNSGTYTGYLRIYGIAKS